MEVSRSLNLAYITEDKLAPKPASASASLCNVPGFFSAAPKGRELRRKEETSLVLMLGRPPCPSGRLVFAIILYVLEDLVWEVQLPVHVARIRIVGVRTDGEVLLVLPLENALAPGRVVVPLLDLLDESPSLVFVGITGSLGSGNPTVRAREKIKAR
jgi:hypothetical protein